ncbi:MAG TPA: NAD(P)H-dependent oxidoreductase subunit E [Bacteroidales bacterium]|nr:NAD(P)H-dependent oxidoreductase subunit E [Bacteroidales bacterium]
MPTQSYEEILQKFPNRQPEDLIQLLHEIQDEHGYLSAEAIGVVSRFLDISVNKIYGVATFYDNFRFAPVGKYHIRICNGTACKVSGSTMLIRELEKQLGISSEQPEDSSLFTLEIVSCLGACGLAPIIEVNGEFYTEMTIQKLQLLLHHLQTKDQALYET